MSMDLLHEYEFECVDINEKYIRHALTGQFPAGMLLGRENRFQDAFQISSNPPNNQTLWVEPIEEISNSIAVHEAQDIASFRGKQKYDIVFMMTIFEHLTSSQQIAVLENMMRQCSGLLCFDLKPPKIDYKTHKGTMDFAKTLGKAELLSEASKRVGEQLKAQGYVIADQVETNIVQPEAGVDIGEALKNSGFSVGFSGAVVAIHPDLAAQIG